MSGRVVLHPQLLAVEDGGWTEVMLEITKLQLKKPFAKQTLGHLVEGLCGMDTPWQSLRGSLRPCLKRLPRLHKNKADLIR
jgi:hypothetical protein